MKTQVQPKALESQTHKKNLTNKEKQAKWLAAAGWLLVFSAMIFLGACSSHSRESEKNQDAEAIRSQISEHNEEINRLTQKVSELERQLEQMGERSNGRRMVPVTTEALKHQPFSHFIKVNSSVEAVREATISPEINGQIKRIEVEKGQRVNAGQVVARLNTSVIESNIQEVKTSLQLARTVYERQQSLWEQEIGSEIQYLEAKNNYESLQTRLKTLESQMDMAVIRAPVPGIVDQIFAKEGELAMPGMPVMHIIDLGLLYINSDLSESFLPVVGTGEEVILRFPAFPDFEERVTVHRVGHMINPENRTFRMQLRITNPGERFKPNMVATVGVRTFHTDSALVVPSILVKQDTQGHFVYIATESETHGLVARKAYIERGYDSEGRSMIRSGLHPGDRVIRQGHNQVSEGARIRETNQTAGLEATINDSIPETE
jgi:membrane fusion protein, multidrug efflux system